MRFRRLATHGGKLHADECFATALVQIINSELDFEKLPESYIDLPNRIPITRVTDREEIETLRMDPTVLMYDVGGGEFDHHQTEGAAFWELPDRTIRKAAFGLLWTHFQKELRAQIGLEELKEVEEKLVQKVDLNDTTGTYVQLCEIIGMYNRPMSTGGVNFPAAVEMAYRILSDYLATAKLTTLMVADMRTMRKEITMFSNGKGEPEFTIWNIYVHIESALIRRVMPNCLFVMYPSDREDGIMLRSCDVEIDGVPCGMRITEKLVATLGHKYEEVQRDWLWVHPAGFISRWATPEAALGFIRKWYAECPDDFAIAAMMAKYDPDKKAEPQQ